MLEKKSFLYAAVMSIAFSISTPTPGSAGYIVFEYSYTPGHRCHLFNGWHWDGLGHHFFGPYFRCIKVPQSQ